MLLLNSELHGQLVLLVGRGLIGSAIESALKGVVACHPHVYEFSWAVDARAERIHTFDSILRKMNSIRQTSRGHLEVHVVWAAGRAGFTAGPSETAPELLNFGDVVSFAESVQHRLNIPANLHMFSSAGGLFEGVRGISSLSAPCPIRPYGELKAAQESIAQAAALKSCSVYRPTSVYSTIQPLKRNGLIPTVVWNTLRNQTTNIFGASDTLRDYIWAGDIGRYVAERIASQECLTGYQTFILATGVPASIDRVLRVIGDVLMRPVPVQFVTPKDKNTLDIVVSPNSVPANLAGTDLATAIRVIYVRLLSDGVAMHG